MVAQGLLRAVAGFGLPGVTRGFPAAALDDETWHDVLVGAEHERLAGHLVEAIDAGMLPATADQRTQACRLLRRWLAQVLHLEQLLLHVVDTLTGAQIDYRVLKGPAVAHLVYENPSARSFADVDVLVPSECFDDAVDALVAAGCHRKAPELRPGFDRRFGKGAILIAPDGYEVDLHRMFSRGPFGLTMDLASPFRTQTVFRLGGRDLRTLDPEVSFLLACYHAALGGPVPRLVPLRDVAQMLLVGRELDLDRARALADAWRAEVVVALAVRSAWQTLSLQPIELSRWAEQRAPTRAERRVLAAYVGPQHGFTAKSLSSLRVIPHTADKAAYLRGVLFPQRVALADWDGSYPGWWRRGMRALLTREDRA